MNKDKNYQQFMINDLLIKSSKCGKYENVKKILDNSEYISYIDEETFHLCFDYACRNGNHKIVKQFLNHEKFSYDALSFQKLYVQPLVSAAKYNREKVIKTILMNPKGRELFSIYNNYKNHSIIDYIILNNNINLLIFLSHNKKLKENIDLKNNENILFKCCSKENIDMFKFIFNNFDFKNFNGQERSKFITKLISYLLLRKNNKIIFYLENFPIFKDIDIIDKNNYILKNIFKSNNFECFKKFEEKFDILNKNSELFNDKNNTYISLVSKLNNLQMFKYIVNQSSENIKKNIIKIIIHTIINGEKENFNYLINDPIFIKKYDQNKLFRELFFENFDKNDCYNLHFKNVYFNNALFGSSKDKTFEMLKLLIKALKRETVEDWENKVLYNIIISKRYSAFEYFMKNNTFTVSSQNIQYLEKIIDKEKRIKLNHVFNLQVYEFIKTYTLYNNLQGKINNKPFKKNNKL